LIVVRFGTGGEFFHAGHNGLHQLFGLQMLRTRQNRLDASHFEHIAARVLPFTDAVGIEEQAISGWSLN
jgi:hypothetical protein